MFTTSCCLFTSTWDMFYTFMSSKFYFSGLGLVLEQKREREKDNLSPRDSAMHWGYVWVERHATIPKGRYDIWL